MHLCAFLEHGEIEISNNHVENAIRPFVVGRKGWFFADTPQGAEASAIIYSLMETACGWMTICSAYCLSAQSRTRILRSKLCSLSQKKWSRGSRQCECWEPRLFCIGGLLSGYASKMSTNDFLTFLCAFHISLNIILTQRLLFCIIMSDGLENMPLVITERKQ